MTATSASPGSPSHLYRFRPIERLLGQNGELQNQQIYFAGPDELNDPMEGFRDIFWQGDKIVWENLFRHYLLCLDRACSLLAICGEDQPFDWSAIPVLHYGETSLTPQQKALQEEIIAKFFVEDAVRSYIEELAGRTQPMRRSELSVHIRCLHQFAICVIYGCYEQHNLVPKQNVNPELYKNITKALAETKKVIGLVRKIETEHANGEAFIDAFFTAHRQINDQLDLLHRYNGSIDTSKVNKNFVFLNFCDEYVKQIECLVYPDWYTACFMRECRNSSVWGSYGVNHTGACLKFKVGTNNGRHVIRLRRQHGYGSAGPLFGHVDHEFLPITYAKGHIPIDFFRSIGRMPIPTLQRYWYSDKEGRRSPCADAMFKSEDDWRKRYWDNFQRIVTSKLEDWSYEQEYRRLHQRVVRFLDQGVA